MYKFKGSGFMTENISSSGKASLNALSDLRSYFRNGRIKSGNTDENLEEENKTTETNKRSDVTRKALSELMSHYSSSEAVSEKDVTEEDVQNEVNQIALQQLDTSQTQSPLEITRPETDTEKNPLQVDTSFLSEKTPLKVSVPDTKTKQTSYSVPKQKNSILYELRNSMHLKYSAWDIAKKYGISYVQAQEIFVELNQNENGVVKEFNLPKNSTVSYLV